MTATYDFRLMRPWAAGAAAVDAGTLLSLDDWQANGMPLPAAYPTDTLCVLTQRGYDAMWNWLVANNCGREWNLIVTAPRSGIVRTGDTAHTTQDATAASANPWSLGGNPNP